MRDHDNMSILGTRAIRPDLRLQAIILALTVSLVAVPCVKPQSQHDESKCAAVLVRKVKYELPKDVKGFKSSPKISYVIELDGSVTNVKVVKSSGSKAVDEAVLDGVKKSSYRPLNPGCGPVNSSATIIIDFF